MKKIQGLIKKTLLTPVEFKFIQEDKRIKEINFLGKSRYHLGFNEYSIFLGDKKYFVYVD